jgi:hypothetical protein
MLISYYDIVFWTYIPFPIIHRKEAEYEKQLMIDCILNLSGDAGLISVTTVFYVYMLIPHKHN